MSEKTVIGKNNGDSESFTGRNPERLAIVEKIKAYEREGRFSEDVESDPPTVPLRPEMVDYLNKKISSKIWMKFANMLARRHILGLMKSGQMIIKEVRGLENFDFSSVVPVIECLKKAAPSIGELRDVSKKIDPRFPRFGERSGRGRDHRRRCRSRIRCGG